MHGAIPGKTQRKDTQFYNLDAIISIGYRINSRRATNFRIWATGVLREYLIKGVALDDERLSPEFVVSRTAAAYPRYSSEPKEVYVMKCTLCTGETQPVITSIETEWGQYRITIHGVNAQRCTSCGEEYFDDNEVDIIQSISAGLSENNAEKPDILNIEEAADLLRLSKQTIYNMLRDGRIKAVKYGREWRFDRKQLMESLQTGFVVAASGPRLTND